MSLSELLEEIESPELKSTLTEMDHMIEGLSNNPPSDARVLFYNTLFEVMTETYGIDEETAGIVAANFDLGSSVELSDNDLRLAASFFALAYSQMASVIRETGLHKKLAEKMLLSAELSLNI